MGTKLEGLIFDDDFNPRSTPTAAPASSAPVTAAVDNNFDILSTGPIINGTPNGTANGTQTVHNAPPEIPVRCKF